MKILHRIVDDLKRGESIDLYATIAVALLVVMLNLFGVVPQDWLVSLTLAVLAIIAGAILGNRQRLEGIHEKLGQAQETKILYDWPDEYKDDLENASEIWLIGVHLGGTVRNRRLFFKDKLQKGIIIRALLVNPDSAACAVAAARIPGDLSIERERLLISATLNDLCELKKVAPDKLEIRVVDDPMPYGGYMFNPEKPNGAIYLKRYSFKTEIRARLVYRPKSQEWFNLIKTEIYTLWQYASEWPCNA